jgi:hypothetical protein
MFFAGSTHPQGLKARHFLAAFYGTAEAVPFQSTCPGSHRSCDFLLSAAFSIGPTGQSLVDSTEEWLALPDPLIAPTSLSPLSRFRSLLP